MDKPVAVTYASFGPVIRMLRYLKLAPWQANLLAKDSKAQITSYCG